MPVLNRSGVINFFMFHKRAGCRHFKFLTLCKSLVFGFLCAFDLFPLNMPPKRLKTYSDVEDVLNDVLDSEFEVSSNSEYGEISSEEALDTRNSAR